jgi:tetratricopeptide (TPR) repeat protein
MEADNPYALIGLGHLHYDFKEFRDALHYWERMVEVHRDNVDIRVLTSIGNCHRKLKTYEDGIYFFNRALDKAAGQLLRPLRDGRLLPGSREQPEIPGLLEPHL